jgi:TetR/AcrR family transcriptional regulator, transcriptional repressor for nem operon
LLTERSVYNKMPVIKIQKEEILHRCWEVLHREGYHATSISMLAEATGLGKAGVLHHFQSKEALMKAVLLYAAEQFRQYVLSVAQEDLPPEQRLEKLLRRQNRLAKLERKGCFFANTALEMARNGQFNDFLMSFFAEWQVAVANILTAVMPATAARDAAYRLLLEYEGAVAIYKISGDEQHLEGLVRRAVSLMTNLLMTNDK